MPEQVSVTGTSWGAGQGHMIDPENQQQPIAAVVAAFSDRETKRTYHFTLTPDEAEKFAEAIMQSAKQVRDETGPPGILVPDRKPTQEELDAMADPARAAKQAAARGPGLPTQP